MANLDAPFGLRPARTSISSQQQNRYRIAANYGTSIFQGDLVAMVTGGGIERVAAGGSGFILGVFNGCEFTDPTTGKPTFSNHYPASTNASDIIANVIDDPNAVFEIQADAAFPVTDLAGNYDILATAGDTTSGTSRIELEVGTADSTVATLPLKAIDISQDPENSDTSTANTNVIVKINNHLFSAGTAGLA
jgi:hypothetical protein|tara:strand:+ start:945 stop:1520 length:576 start_codon:yes stop_codon:yes gene_type:complete